MEFSKLQILGFPNLKIWAIVIAELCILWHQKFFREKNMTIKQIYGLWALFIFLCFFKNFLLKAQEEEF
jgi:hypothetical protein